MKKRVDKAAREEKKRREKGACPYGNHAALGGHVGGSVGEAQLGLQRVEERLELGLLLDARRLVLAPVHAVLLQLLLHAGQRVVRLARLQPRQSLADPLQQLRSPSSSSSSSSRINHFPNQV